MNPDKSMVERLVEEGVLDTYGLSAEQQEAINNLTEEEIQALISIKEKLSEFSWPIRPMMF